ncbi:M61 family peptidase [Cytophagaceae bacterium YF14B1]|uniref:M61 family peptidase n=1 Tax=Xanthocytophaga flava TaxID=3048013 RepID=A0AAE3QXR3_9BACT|nr:M61 family peptidase [Xanthocytophaga flavus]MDJ1484689.1 M61 family peptidase [Xanthocytophaga flavus]
MHYTIDCRTTSEHILNITMHIEQIDTPVVDLQLPAWRPGRYELSNYAKNILSVRSHTTNQEPLFIEKITRERWRIHMNGNTEATVNYEYYAQQMDAGNSWLDENLVYINFINCLFYVTERMDEPCHVKLLFSNSYTVGCGLKAIEPYSLYAKDYYELADSPMMASASLQHYTYHVDQIPFHIWIQGGEGMLNWEKALEDFCQFTEVQINTMGEFPQKDYHFLLFLLPYQHYHGVEHRNSTVMTLGPAEQIGHSLYEELMGLASHELFHAWNICTIRPKELLPYDLTQENYFPTGYVAEGVTTYYGDLFLARSGFFDPSRYYAEITRTFNRHFMQSNAARLSLIESSFDLWVDGYSAGVPNRKVSIYHKGALAAFILDMEIRRSTNDQKSLDTVIQLLWQRFGKSGIGYTHDDYIAIAEEVAGHSLKDYFAACITGTEPLQNYLANVLAYIGCVLQIFPLVDKPGCVEILITPVQENESREKWLQNTSAISLY